jgi:hydrogenase nickel incorporation protein HypA/HybF
VHELSLANAIVDTVVRHADGRRVTAVQLRVGALRQVVPASLDFYWDVVSRETACEGARLEQELVPARLRCAACEDEWDLERPVLLCPRCGSGESVEVASGDELEVESIEVVEKEDAACTAPR